MNIDSFDFFRLTIQNGDIESLKQLLQCENLEFIDNVGWTVLHEAARRSNEDIICLLLQDRRGQELLNHNFYDGNTPLLSAIMHSNAAATRIFLDYGANIFYQEKQTGDTVLHYAARLLECTIMNILLALNLPLDFINTTNKSGDRALDVALKTNSQTVQVLLQAGADYFKCNPITKRTLLHTSVAYGQCGIVQELLSFNEIHNLIYKADKRGDTPQMLAIRISCVKCVKNLVPFMRPDKCVNKKTGESLLHIAVKTNSSDILKYILMYSSLYLINHADKSGMTPLLLAIEKNKDACLKELIKTTCINAVNAKNKETVFHAAIRTNNHRALSLLLKYNDPDIFWCFKQKNAEGKTPFWMAIELGHAAFITEVRKGGWIDIDELNNEGDTPTFVAAAFGKLNVLKTLILSEKYFVFSRLREREGTDMNDDGLIRNAKVCFDIYESDIFILTGEENIESKRTSWFPQSFFQCNKRNGRNIFHAGALGGNVHCLEFVYKLCKLFHFDINIFDAPDKRGNTLLLLATKNDYGGPDCVYFFLTHEASLLARNKTGDTVLESLLNNSPNAVKIIIRVLNQGISYDKTAKGLDEDNSSLQINFSLLRHENEPVTRVIKQFFELSKSPYQKTILQHKLITTYINLILLSVKYLFVTRLILSCISTLLLTLFILVFPGCETCRHEISRMIIAILSIIGILFSIPLLFVEKVNVLTICISTLLISPCCMTIVLMMMPIGSDLFFDIASITVLVSWLSLMMYSTTVFKNLSRHICILSHLIRGMFIYARIVIIVLLAFSICFQCILGNYFYFVSPIKAFVYTTFILREGDFSTTFEFFESKHFTGQQIQNNSYLFINERFSYVISHLDFFFESMFLVTFVITCVFGLVHMLVGLAVQDSRTLEIEGQFFQKRLHINWLNSLELFLNSPVYKIFASTPFIYLFGIVPSNHLFDVKLHYIPMNKRNSSRFSRATLILMKVHGSKPGTEHSLEKEHAEDTTSFLRT